MLEDSIASKRGVQAGGGAVGRHIGRAADVIRIANTPEKGVNKAGRPPLLDLLYGPTSLIILTCSPLSGFQRLSTKGLALRVLIDTRFENGILIGPCV